jgi:ADP-heptose:LPS heptosyltransferase
MHIAVGLKLKTVTIMGPVDEKVYGPYPPTGNNIILTRATGCRPCYRNFRLPLCVNNRKCLSEIGVDEVMDAVRRLL